jgi:hypothetical protein
MNRIGIISVYILYSLVISGAGDLYSQTIRSYDLHKNLDAFPSPPSNSASHATSRNDSLWFGTSRGLTRTVDGGSSWTHFRTDEAFQPHGIFSVHLGTSAIWISTGDRKETTAGSQQAGSGYTYSRDGGETWHYVGQPIDDFTTDTLEYGNNRIPVLGITTDINNITYSTSSLGDEVWTASFAGGLQRSDDFGNSWKRVILPPDHLDAISPDDELNFALSPIAGQLIPEGHLNHRVFSVHVARDSTLWVGTANGVNLSIDNGVSWRKYNFQNQLNGILGNWVIKIADQKLADGTLRIWTTNWRADDLNEVYGVSYTDDHGETWTNVLHNIQAYDFAFRDSIVYIATNEGLMRSVDGGATWEGSGSITDLIARQRFVTREVLSVATTGDYVWVGTSEGIARTDDRPGSRFGYEWKIFRTFTEIAGTKNTYAYPNPFSPSITVTRIHYDTDNMNTGVSIELFDFAMNRIRTLIRNADRSGTQEHDEIWDGKDDNGNIVPNGVYFYRVSIGGDEERWGKVMVLR